MKTTTTKGQGCCLFEESSPAILENPRNEWIETLNIRGSNNPRKRHSQTLCASATTAQPHHLSCTTPPFVLLKGFVPKSDLPSDCSCQFAEKQRTKKW